jgi:hypothetical protein
VLSGAPQGSTLDPLLFKMFVNDFFFKIKHSKFLLFADDLKMYGDIKSVKDCKAFQVDIDSIQQWCVENCMEFNIQKTKTIYFTRKNVSVHFNYYVSDVLILRTDSIKDLGVILDSKLNFHCHVDFVYSQALRTLGLISYITHNFCSLDSLLVLYHVIIRSKLEYASVVWNNLTLTDPNKLENIQRKFVNLCYYRFFQHDILRNCYLILDYLSRRTLYSRLRHLDAIFLINVFKANINWHSILDIVGVRVPTRQIR